MIEDKLDLDDVEVEYTDLIDRGWQYLDDHKLISFEMNRHLNNIRKELNFSKWFDSLNAAFTIAAFKNDDAKQEWNNWLEQIIPLYETLLIPESENYNYAYEEANELDESSIKLSKQFESMIKKALVDEPSSQAIESGSTKIYKIKTGTLNTGYTFLTVYHYNKIVWKSLLMIKNGDRWLEPTFIQGKNERDAEVINELIKYTHGDDQKLKASYKSFIDGGNGFTLTDELTGVEVTSRNVDTYIKRYSPENEKNKGFMIIRDVK